MALPVWLALLAPALAAGDTPPLRLGESAWRVDADVWELDTAVAELSDGYAFPVTDRAGRPRGWIFAGEATVELHDQAPQSLLAATVERELGDQADGRRWTVHADLALALGAGGPGRASVDWRPLAIDNNVLIDISDPDLPNLLVDELPRLRAAQRRARRALEGRAPELAALGIDLQGPTPTPGWGLLDLRTSLELGALAGNRPGPGDRWLLSLERDPLLPQGVASATLTTGLRRVDLETGC